MHVRMMAVDLHGGMKYTSKSVSQARYIVIQPITICKDDIIDVPNQVLVPSNSIFEASRSGLFLSFDEKRDIGLQLLFVHEVHHTIQSSHNWPLVIRHTTAVQIP